MDFSEKLTAMISLTSIKSVALAKALNIDTAQISRLKTGAREMPQNPKLLHDISKYFAEHLDNDYKQSGLYELTKDVRLQYSFDKTVLIDVIYTWLSTPDEYLPGKQIGTFFKNLNQYSVDSTVVQNYTKINPSASVIPPFRTYKGNEGKRNAARDFRDYCLSFDSALTIKVFSDEADDWLIEDEKYALELAEFIQMTVHKGYNIQRIQPPAKNLNGTLQDLERWMPCFLTGSIKMLFYPWFRDELHRITLLLVPDKIAFFCGSLFGMHEAQMTMLTTDPDSLHSYDTYFEAIAHRCRTMMTAYSHNDVDTIMERLDNLSQIEEEGINKSNCLSAHTMPESLFHSISSRAGQQVSNLLRFYFHNELTSKKILESKKLTEVINLPSIDNVLAGKEPIPGLMNLETLYYTPEEYRMHLENLIWYLRTYPNYQLILLEHSGQDDLVVYSKGDKNAILIKETSPFAVFEVIERELATAFSGYLKNIISKKLIDYSREKTISLLQREILKLDQK